MISWKFQLHPAMCEVAHTSVRMNRSSGVVSAVGAAGPACFFSIWASGHVLAAAGAGRFKSVVLRPTVTVLGGKTAKRQK